MPLDKQIAGVLQQFRDLPEPDFSQVDAAQYRQFFDNLLPAIPGDPMSEVRDLKVAGADGDLDARLYRPSQAPDLPLLVYFHGGGFVMGNLDTHDNLCRSLARQTEAVVVSVAYRLAPEHPFPAAPLDCYAATCWLVEHAAELRVDGSRLAVAGDSAGSDFSQLLDSTIRQGMTPAELAALVFAAVAQKRFWILPHKGFKPALERRVQSILGETNPQFQMTDVEDDAHAAR